MQCTDNVWSDDCTVTFCDRRSDAIIDANTVMSIPYFMAAVLFPVFGQLVDWYGYRATGLVVAPIILVLVHSLLGFTRVNPIPLMIGQGLAYSIMASALWPAIPLVVNPDNVGLAYGVAFSMQNVGLTIIPLIMAAIYTSSNEKYIPNVEIFLISIAGAACCVGVWLCRYDSMNGGDLNAPAKCLLPPYEAISETDGYCTDGLGQMDGSDNGDAEIRTSRTSRLSNVSASSAYNELLALRQ